MTKVLKKAKKVKEEEEALPEEVVFLSEAQEVVMENARVLVEILQSMAVCSECGGTREE